MKKKEGASPGAVFAFDDGEYLVKLNMPPGHGPIKLKKEADFYELVDNISKEACNEKIFFNIAQAVGNNHYLIPETNIIKLKPLEYDILGRSVDILTERFANNVRGFQMNEGTNGILEKLKNEEMYHFTSKIIPLYKDLSVYYDYHHNKENSTNVHNIQEGIPEEPRGMGAFFALNCFTGNRDCIGQTGKNAGVDPETFQIIIVDGGLSQEKADVVKTMPSSANNKVWLDYEYDLSADARLEALETFARLVELNEEQIRNILTNGGQFTAEGVFNSEEINIKLQKFMEQQKQVVDVFYEDLKMHGLVTKKIDQIKQSLDIEKAQKEAKNVMIGSFVPQDTAMEVVQSPVKGTPKKRKNLGLSIITVTPQTPDDKMRVSISEAADAGVSKITQDLLSIFNEDSDGHTTSPSSNSSDSRSPKKAKTR